MASIELEVRENSLRLIATDKLGKAYFSNTLKLKKPGDECICVAVSLPSSEHFIGYIEIKAKGDEHV